MLKVDDLTLIKGSGRTLLVMEPKAHCADHPVFHKECATCRRALANTQPYPVRPAGPDPPRAYGYTDKITEATFAGSDRQTSSGSEDGVNLSRAALRLILKLIWPFSKWNI